MATQGFNKTSFLKRSLVLSVAFILLLLLTDKVILPAYVQQGKTTKVPNVTGVPFEEALTVLSKSGLVGKKSEERLDKQLPIGYVITQNPPQDAEVKFGRGVYLTISGGEPTTYVPALRGRTVRDAAFTLERNGLKLGPIRFAVSSDFPVNTIIDQAVAESTKVSLGLLISVTVSQGPSQDQVPVPDLIKRTLSEAEKLLLQAGLKVGNITSMPDPDLLPNTIIDQYPRSGQMATIGQAIDLVVIRKGEKSKNIEH